LITCDLCTAWLVVFRALPTVAPRNSQMGPIYELQQLAASLRLMAIS
jgi:hypothetical protein